MLESYEARIIELESQLKIKETQISELIATNDRLTKQLYDSPLNGFANQKKDDEDFSEPEQFRKLFVGGLNYTTTSEILSQHFLKFGEVVDCVVMKDPTTKRSRGFGFIVFSRVSMVDAAQASRPHYIDGREVETKRAVPKGEQLPYEKQMRVKKIFVGGLKETTTEDHLTSYFGAYGRVNHVDLIEDRQTKRKRGFAYVTFNDCDPVDKAVLQKFHTIDGRRCEVKKAISRAEMGALSSQPYLSSPQPHPCPCTPYYSSNFFHRCCVANRYEQPDSSNCFGYNDKDWPKPRNFNNVQRTLKNGNSWHRMKPRNTAEETVS